MAGGRNPFFAGEKEFGPAGGSEKLNSLADGNDPTADVVEVGFRNDAFRTTFLKRRQHDFRGLASVNREKEFFFVAEFHEHGIAVAGSIRPAEEQHGPDRKEPFLLLVDLNGEVSRHDR